ncbi:MAG: hypothetical protein IJM33_03050 [Bacteroidales bacterium]|nr:hypothetical protein [Bacteroidales bacterium]
MKTFQQPNNAYPFIRHKTFLRNCGPMPPLRGVQLAPPKRRIHADAVLCFV